MTFTVTDYECCPHCEHDTDGGPPHEDPCPVEGCADGKRAIVKTVASQAVEDARRMWRAAFGTDPR